MKNPGKHGESHLETIGAKSSGRLYDLNFAIALIAQTFFTLANTLTAHYNRWIEFLDGSVDDVGWIMGTGSVAGLVLRPWMGPWINRMGARTVWFGGCVVFATGSIGSLFFQDLGASIYVLRSCLAAGAAISFASSLTYITQVTPAERRTEAIGIFGAGGFLGMLIGPLLGDVILGSGARTTSDFATLFMAMTGALVATSLLLFFLKPSVPHRASSIGLKEFVRTAWQYWPGTILVVCIAFGACMTVPFVFLASFVDEFQLKISGLSIVGLFFWGYAGWGLTVRVGFRRLPDRVGRRKVLLTGLLFMGMGMFCFPFVNVDRPWLLLFPAMCCGTGHALMFHTMSSLALESFPNHVRGTGSALSLMMLDMGMVGGAPILGLIAENFGFSWLFVSLGTINTLALVVYSLSSIPIWRARRETSPVKEAIAPTPVSPAIALESNAGCADSADLEHVRP